MKICIDYYTYKLNTKANLLKEYVNIAHNTKKQSTYFKMLFLFVNIIVLFLFYLLLK